LQEISEEIYANEFMIETFTGSFCVYLSHDLFII